MKGAISHMKKNEIEYWVLSVIERVNKNQPVEDDRVELKGTWIDAVSAARRIAGHANAAKGEDILWLIGVDEKDGVKGVEHKDYAEWFDKVTSQFDERLVPQSVCINVPYESKTVLAILFETDRAPYVVKNPAGGSIQFEVPWRTNTSTKTANRRQLLQILLPQQRIPNIELLSGELQVYEDVHEKDWHWTLNLQLYASSNIKTPLVIPFHQCEVLVEFEKGIMQFELDNVELMPPSLKKGGWSYVKVGEPNIAPSQRPQHDSVTIDGTSSELIISGAGKFTLSGKGSTQKIESDILSRNVNLNIKLQPVDTDRFIRIELSMDWINADRSGSNQIGSWEFLVKDR